MYSHVCCSFLPCLLLYASKEIWFHEMKMQILSQKLLQETRMEHRRSVALFYFALASFVGLSARKVLCVGYPSGFSENVVGRGCDLYSGSWVKDLGYPLYDWKSCPYFDEGFDCQKYGRPDQDYMHYRWQPTNCNISRFDAVAFLEKLRGKTLMFVGDSLARNQYQSMLCLLYSVAGMPGSNVKFFENDPISSFKLLDYEMTLKFHSAPYLVEIKSAMVEGSKKGVLCLDCIEKNGDLWKDADVLVFHSGHWWTHTGGHRGYDLVEQGSKFYKHLDMLLAYQMGLTTWANWVDSTVNPTKTRVVFSSYSPTHTSPPEKHNCYGVSEPMTEASSSDISESFPELFQVAANVVASMKSRVEFLNLTMMSLLRKDAHPSVYLPGLSPDQRRDPDIYSDCSHWCVPGLPDIWNELLYTIIDS